MARVILRPGKEKPVRNRHPWVFSGAIARVDGQPRGGDLVDVIDATGQWQARGYYNDRSQIVVRLLTWEQDEPVGTEWWRDRMAAAGARRALISDSGETTAYRLVYAESDGLPGLIIDRYGDWLVMQFLTLGVEARRDSLVAAAVDLFRPEGIVDRSDVPVRRQEGLAPHAGAIFGSPPPDGLEIRENGLRFPVGLLEGQKTGFYLDQRDNRAIVGRLSRGARVLNAFSFTGAFGVYALAGGAAHVTNVDASYPALQGAEAALRANNLDPDTQAEGIAGDVFQVLRDLARSGERYDLVILDPPKFASRKDDITAATRGYKDVNMLGLELLNPGGLLATFSCSGLISPDLFQKVVFGASVDTAVPAQIVGRFGQPPDHPILLTFPEGEYLKGLLLRV